MRDNLQRRRGTDSKKVSTRRCLGSGNLDAGRANVVYNRIYKRKTPEERVRAGTFSERRGTHYCQHRLVHSGGTQSGGCAGLNLQ